MMFKINNFLKKIFIFNWNLFSKINFFYNHNFKFKKNSLKHIKVLIVKPSNYSDLYSAGLKNTIETIKSSQYRMGPIGILTEFNAKVVISNYNRDQYIKTAGISYFGMGPKAFSIYSTSQRCPGGANPTVASGACSAIRKPPNSSAL